MQLTSLTDFSSEQSKKVNHYNLLFVFLLTWKSFSTDEYNSWISSEIVLLSKTVVLLKVTLVYHKYCITWNKKHLLYFVLGEYQIFLGIIMCSQREDCMEFLQYKEWLMNKINIFCIFVMPIQNTLLKYVHKILKYQWL